MNTVPLPHTKGIKRGVDRAAAPTLRRPGPTLDELLAAVAAEYDMTVEQLIGYRISPEYIDARAVFFALGWELTSAPVKALYSMINRKNNVTISRHARELMRTAGGQNMRRRVMERLS